MRSSNLVQHTIFGNPIINDGLFMDKIISLSTGIPVSLPLFLTHLSSSTDISGHAPR